jgi:hypothetical protein
MGENRIGMVDLAMGNPTRKAGDPEGSPDVLLVAMRSGAAASARTALLFGSVVMG